MDLGVLLESPRGVSPRRVCGVPVRFPPELGNGNGAPLDVGGIIVLPLEWRRVCQGTS